MLVITVLIGSNAFADDSGSCLDCHSKSIDLDEFSDSVHGELTCSSCHINILEYPHKMGTSVNCTSCHFPGKYGAPMESAQAYGLSVHGSASKKGIESAPECKTCHGSHGIFTATDLRSLTSREKIPSLCAQCHNKAFEEYRESVHGKEFLEMKNLGAATCFDCHMEHFVSPVETDIWKLALIKECGICHTRVLDSYRETYHGKVTQLKYTTAAKCTDCHGAHKILPKNDEASTLSELYIVSTCSKCHAGATMRFTQFYAHAEEHNRAKYPLLFYTNLFMTILLITVFTLFFLHTFLWFYRSIKEQEKRKRGGE